MTDVDALLAADAALMDARLRQDRDAYGSLLHPAFVGTDAGGRTTTASQRVQEFPSVTYDALALEDRGGVVTGDVGVVTQTMVARGLSAGMGFEGRFRLTHVWLRTPAGWRAIAAHASRLRG